MHYRVATAFEAPDHKVESPYKRRKTEVQVELDATLEQHLRAGGSPAEADDVGKLEQRLWEELMLAESGSETMSAHHNAAVATATSSTSKADILKRIAEASKAHSEIPERLGIATDTMTLTLKDLVPSSSILNDQHLDAMLERHFEMPSSVEARRGSLEVEWEKLVLGGSKDGPTTPTRDSVHGETQFTPVEEKQEKPQRKSVELQTSLEEKQTEAKQGAFAFVLQELKGELGRPRAKGAKPESKVYEEQPGQQAVENPSPLRQAALKESVVGHSKTSPELKTKREDKENIIEYEPMAQEVEWSPSRARRPAAVPSSLTSSLQSELLVPVEEREVEEPCWQGLAAMLKPVMDIVRRVHLADLLKALIAALHKVKGAILPVIQLVTTSFMKEPTRKPLVQPGHGNNGYQTV